MTRESGSGGSRVTRTECEGETESSGSDLRFRFVFELTGKELSKRGERAPYITENGPSVGRQLFDCSVRSGRRLRCGRPSGRQPFGGFLVCGRRRPCGHAAKTPKRVHQDS